MICKLSQENKTLQLIQKQCGVFTVPVEYMSERIPAPISGLRSLTTDSFIKEASISEQCLYYISQYTTLYSDKQLVFNQIALLVTVYIDRIRLV